MNKEDLNKLTNKIIGIAIKIHKKIRPGFTEKTYCKALKYELEKAKIKYSRENIVNVDYEGLTLGRQRIDFLVEDELILEIKVSSAISKIFIGQLLSYLKASNRRLGLILNFGQSKLDIKRLVNNF